jgi:hypothetical protein
MFDGVFSLASTLDLVEQSLPFALASEDLVVPPLLPNSAPAPEALQAFAVLYVHAELETTALVTAAEALAEHRLWLRASPSLAATLERFVDLSRELPTARDRQQLLARLFGFGAGQGTGTLRAPVNHAFLGQLAALCGALVRLADEARMPGAQGPRASTQQEVRDGVQRLVLGFSSYGQGGLGLWAARLNAGLAAARAIIEHPELAPLLGVTNAKGVLRALTDGAAVDLEIAAQRADAGHRVLAACVHVAQKLRSYEPLFSPNDPVCVRAAAWLAAYGFHVGSRT